MRFLKKLGIIIAAFLVIYFLLSFPFHLKNVPSDAHPRPTSIPTAIPTSTAPPDNILDWANYFADQHETKDIQVRDVRLIDSEAHGQDVCFIVDVNCEHSNTALQFSHLNDVMINICKSMSNMDHFDCVSFTVYDTFVDKYGNTKDIVSITASYKVSTLRKINYSYQESYSYSKPKGFIMCGDSHYIYPGYSFK